MWCNSLNDTIVIRKRSEVELIADIGFFLYLITEMLFRYTIIGQIGLIIFIMGSILLSLSNFKIKSSYYFLFSGLFIIYNWLNVRNGVSIYSETSLEMIDTLIVNFIAMFFLYNYIVLRNDMRSTIKIFVFAVSMVSIYVIVFSIPTLTSQRLGTALGINANFLAISASFAFLMCFYFYLEKKGSTYRNKFNSIIVNFTIFFLFVVVLLTGSRKGLVIMLVGGVLLLYLLFPNRRLKYLIVSLFASFITYILIMNIPFLYNSIGMKVESLLTFLGGSSTEEASLNTRNTLTERGWEYFLMEPYRGYGLDNFKNLPRTYGVYSHNNYIELLVSGGIIALFLYYISYVIALFKAYNGGRKGNPIMKLMFTIIILMMMAEYALVTYYGRIYLTLIIIVVSFISINKQSQRKDYSTFRQKKEVKS